MDEQNAKKVRRISGRLTDTIKEPEILDEQEVFTPRRPGRPEQKIVQMDRPMRTENPVRPERPERKHSDAAKNIGAIPPNTGKRRRAQENEARMRTLWSALGILTILLTAAIIYEIVLGHGTKQTGSERMAVQKQENIIEILDDAADIQTEVVPGESELSETE